LEQVGEYRISAPRETVWAALNDPETLKKCIDGCQSMEQTAEDTFAAAVKAKIGPVSALFKADLTLADRNPPTSYAINASAKGGAAGFGKGVARVTLNDDGDGTLLNYRVDANVGGKLAQIGSRLIDGAARKMADDFFAKFSAEVGGAATPERFTETDSALAVNPSDAPDAPEADTPADSVSPDGSQRSQKWKIWAIMFVILALAVVLAL